MSISIEGAAPPLPDQILYRWRGRYGLVLGTCGEDWLMASDFDGVFLINIARRTIRCFVARFEDPAWLDVFVRRVLPRVAILSGATAIHAAAVASHGGSLLLLGASGAGKSTLSASLGAAGWDVLSDDIAILRHDTVAEAMPATTGVCVWNDSRARLKLPASLCQPMPGYEGKVRFVPQREEDIAPVPLRALIFLARSSDVDHPRFEQLSGSEGLARAMQQRIRFNPADASGCETTETFARIGAIVRETPSYRMVYPASYDALPDVASALATMVQP
jgi:hypothetical protein